MKPRATDIGQFSNVTTEPTENTEFKATLSVLSVCSVVKICGLCLGALFRLKFFVRRRVHSWFSLCGI